MDLYSRAVRRLVADSREGEVCTVCDCTRATPQFEVSGCPAPIVVCPECGVARFDPMPSESEVASFYPSEYYGSPGAKFLPLVEWWIRAVAARHVRFLSAGLPEGARVLDVGCGRGVVLGPLADRGFETHGVEVSENATRGADSRAQLRIASRLSEAGYASDYFDQIVIWHVLEHLRDPRETLDECRRILKPGGRIVVAVPNFSSWQARLAGPHWFHLDAPRHLFQFPLAGLRQLLERCGFDCLGDYHFSLRQNPFGWIQSLQNRWSPQRPNRLYTTLQGGPGAAPEAAGPKTALGRRLMAAPWLLLGTLPAVALSILAATFRSGATVHVVAEARREDR
ncbi:MAG: class I SAM-dependent methyltransferase [Myxococcota bacterium]|jgi:SAM-dependent methyltransferase|nr:class I SAM-dependent methyltransferase [Myxococcota bacterium]